MGRKTETILTLRVKMKMPPGSNAKYCADYVRDAVRSHAGGLDPDDVMFSLENESVTVSLLKKETSYA
jgi:hypothetical protein